MLLAFELAERHMLEHGWHPPLNFIIIGGGPTGVELAGAVSDIARLYMRHDFRHIDPSMAKESCSSRAYPRVLSTFPPDLSVKALKQLEDIGVVVQTNKHVTDVGAGYVSRSATSASKLWLSSGLLESPPRP